VDDGAVPWICQFERLVSLGVGGCRGFSSAGMLALFERLPSPARLRDIKLHGLFRSLTDQNLRVLAQRAGSNLRSIDLSGNRLSDRTVKNLSTYVSGGHLRALTLRKCAVSPLSIGQLLVTFTLALVLAPSPSPSPSP
jgi:hypothetical protein